MTIYRTPYDTTQCEGFGPGVAKTQHQLKAALAVGVLASLSQDMLLVQDGDNYRNTIPGFTHPMLVDNKVSQEKDYRPCMAADVRPFGAWSRNQENFIIRDTSGYNLTTLRLRLSVMWLSEARNYLRNVSNIPVKMFTSWISESLQRKFALEPLEQLRIAILAGILYHSNFSDQKTLDETEKARLAASLSRDLGIEAKEILIVLDQHPVVDSVDHFCEIAAEVGGVRLRNLKRGLLYESLGGSWFGYNYKEILATALEHPATWLALVYSAGTDRSYKATGLTKLFERVSRNGADQLFFNSLKKLLENCAPVNA